jgi:hypothetical protein
VRKIQTGDHSGLRLTLPSDRVIANPLAFVDLGPYRLSRPSHQKRAPSRLFRPLRSAHAGHAFAKCASRIAMASRSEAFAGTDRHNPEVSPTICMFLPTISSVRLRRVCRSRTMDTTPGRSRAGWGIARSPARPSTPRWRRTDSRSLAGLNGRAAVLAGFSSRPGDIAPSDGNGPSRPSSRCALEEQIRVIDIPGWTALAENL